MSNNAFLFYSKTRLFVTNSLSFLPQVDQIWMLENGVIEEAGSYEELRKKNGLFSEFIKNYLASNEVNKDKNGIYLLCFFAYFFISCS